MEASLKKKIINQIYSFNFLEKNSEKYKNKQANVLDVKKNWNIKKLFKNINKKKYDYLTINTKKIFFKFLTSSLLIYKNTYVFYEINSEVRGENIFPVWPRSYKELSFFQSFYFWIKKLGLIFLYSSKIQLILIKIK